MAIQGKQGSFHAEAAQQWFGDNVTLLECASFSEVFHTADNGDADMVVTAVENTLYGSINEVYQLIEECGWPIVGEVKLSINHQLITLPEATMHDITKVYSHPVALAQCRHTIEKLLPHAEMVEYFDTAGAVEFVRESKNPANAAVASRGAAELYGMPILKNDIHDNQHNATRFLVLAPNTQHQPVEPNRASIVLKTNHQPGALVNALTAFADAGINLVKLQSQPIIGAPWQYKFFVVADCSSEQLTTVLAALDTHGHQAHVLGQYRAA